MSRLIKIKEWLTLVDAAQYLTIVLDEAVTEADLLRFALDGYLKLSVDFVNHARARSGKIVSWEETKWLKCRPIVVEPTPNKPLKEVAFPRELESLIDELPPEERGVQRHFMTSINIDGERFLNMNKEVETIRGVWDLAMVGSERLDVEHAYQFLTGGPAVTLINIEGTFVQNSDDKLYQLQESFDNNEYNSGSEAELEKLKAKIANEQIEKSEAEKLLYKHEEERKKYLKRRESQPEYMNYFPAGGLPADSVLVVRTEAIQDFIRKITETEKKISEKPLLTNERNSLLTIIGLMAKDGYGNDLSKPYALAKEIQKAADMLNIKISEDTIAGKLKDAQKILDEKRE